MRLRLLAIRIATPPAFATGQAQVQKPFGAHMPKEELPMVAKVFWHFVELRYS